MLKLYNIKDTILFICIQFRKGIMNDSIVFPFIFSTYAVDIYQLSYNINSCFTMFPKSKSIQPFNRCFANEISITP